MVSVHRVHTHERDDMCSRGEMSSETIMQLTARTSSLEEQYQFFQETRGYVRDLVECLNEKVRLLCSLCLSIFACLIVFDAVVITFAYCYSTPDQEQSIVMSARVCVCVCRQSYLWNYSTTRTVFANIVACYLFLLLGPPLAA